MADKIEFSRGDGNYHEFFLPASKWTAGGKLFFAAKAAIDDDTTDANAVIDSSWDDAAVSDITIDGVAYKKYACTFAANATNSILSNGAGSIDYLGEFQFVPTVGDPQTYPGDDQKFDCIVYFDVKRKTT